MKLIAGSDEFFPGIGVTCKDFTFVYLQKHHLKYFSKAYRLADVMIGCMFV